MSKLNRLATIRNRINEQLCELKWRQISSDVDHEVWSRTWNNVQLMVVSQIASVIRVNLK